MAVEAVVFDLDGTLLDTSEGIFRTANTVAGIMGYGECRDLERFSLFVGPPLHVGFSKVFGLEGDENRKAVSTYKKLYRSVGIDRYCYYPGLVEVVEALKRDGFKLGVATLKNESAATEMLSSSRYGGLFDVIKGSDEAETLTKAMMLEAVCAELKVPVSSAILAGDSESDENGARQAGLRFIPVSWGFGFQGRDKNGLEFATDPSRLYDMIIKERL